MRNALMQHPADAIALADDMATLRYGELCTEITCLAQQFAAIHAISGGAFAIALPDSVAWVVADLACLEARIPCVPLPPFFTDAQRVHVVAHTGVTHIITTQGPQVLRLVAGRPVALAETGFTPVPLPRGTAKITYTSGTTGTPKGVCLCAAAMLQQAGALRTMLGPALIERHRTLLPLSVLLENIAGVYVALLAGAEVTVGAVAPEPFALAEALRTCHATSCIFVPQLLQLLIATGEPFPALRFAAVGGAQVPPRLVAQARAHGLPVYEGYGLSEACSVVSLNLPGRDRPGACGIPLAHAALHVAEDGEVMLDRPMFLGYVGEPAPAMPFATGDIGHIDADGFLHITGRKKNIIVTSFGRNLSPEWVEGELLAEPGVMQAVVYGEARPFNCAVVVAQDTMMAERALVAANMRLPEYAQVRCYVLAEAPFTLERGEMTPTGKPQRTAIYNHYQSLIEAQYERNVA